MIVLSCARYIFPKLIGLNKLFFFFVLHIFILYCLYLELHIQTHNLARLQVSERKSRAGQNPNASQWDQLCLSENAARMHERAKYNYIKFN